METPAVNHLAEQGTQPTPEAGAEMGHSRRQLAAQRAAIAWPQLRRCGLCAHRCGVNRLAGEVGPCHAGTTAHVFHAQTEVSDEAELAPVFAVAFGGCDLRCDFCNTGRDSWNAQAGTLTARHPQDSAEAATTGYAVELAARIRQALAHNARSVMILGGEPTIHLPAVLEFVSLLPDDARLVWKTNAHGTAAARELLDGVFDVWVADYKFGNDLCAQQLAKVPDYTAIVRENLVWASTHTELIVRHLLMPGHLECCWRPVAEWLASELPGVKVSLRTGFWPGWFSARHPKLVRTTSIPEEQQARELAARLGLRLIP